MTDASIDWDQLEQDSWQDNRPLSPRAQVGQPLRALLERRFGAGTREPSPRALYYDLAAQRDWLLFTGELRPGAWDLATLWDQARHLREMNVVVQLRVSPQARAVSLANVEAGSESAVWRLVRLAHGVFLPDEEDGSLARATSRERLLPHWGNPVLWFPADWEAAKRRVGACAQPWRFYLGQCTNAAGLMLNEWFSRELTPRADTAPLPRLPAERSAEISEALIVYRNALWRRLRAYGVRYVSERGTVEAAQPTRAADAQVLKTDLETMVATLAPLYPLFVRKVLLLLRPRLSHPRELDVCRAQDPELRDELLRVVPEFGALPLSLLEGEADEGAAVFKAEAFRAQRLADALRRESRRWLELKLSMLLLQRRVAPHFGLRSFRFVGAYLVSAEPGTERSQVLQDPALNALRSATPEALFFGRLGDAGEAAERLRTDLEEVARAVPRVGSAESGFQQLSEPLLASCVVLRPSRRRLRATHALLVFRARAGGQQEEEGQPAWQEPEYYEMSGSRSVREAVERELRLSTRQASPLAPRPLPVGITGLPYCAVLATQLTDRSRLLPSEATDEAVAEPLQAPSDDEPELEAQSGDVPQEQSQEATRRETDELPPSELSLSPFDPFAPIPELDVRDVFRGALPGAEGGADARSLASSPIPSSPMPPSPATPPHSTIPPRSPPHRPTTPPPRSPAPPHASTESVPAPVAWAPAVADLELCVAMELDLRSSARLWLHAYRSHVRAFLDYYFS